MIVQTLFEVRRVDSPASAVEFIAAATPADAAAEWLPKHNPRRALLDTLDGGTVMLQVVNPVTEVIYYLEVGASFQANVSVKAIDPAQVTAKLAETAKQQLAKEKADAMRAMADFFGLPLPLDFEKVSQQVYDETECGAWLRVAKEEDGIEIGSIIEGSQAECQTHCLKWGEITSISLREALLAVEEEADILFKEAHGEETSWDNTQRGLSVVPSLELFRTSQRMEEEDEATVVVDFLTNLRHYCNDRPDVSFTDSLRLSSDHFAEETRVEDSSSELFRLAKEISSETNRWDVTVDVLACAFQLVDEILHGRVLQLQAPLDDTEQILWDEMQEKFPRTHRVWNYITVLAEESIV